MNKIISSLFEIHDNFFLFYNVLLEGQKRQHVKKQGSLI